MNNRTAKNSRYYDQMQRQSYYPALSSCSYFMIASSTSFKLFTLSLADWQWEFDCAISFAFPVFSASSVYASTPSFKAFMDASSRLCLACSSSSSTPSSFFLSLPLGCLPPFLVSAAGLPSSFYRPGTAGTTGSLKQQLPAAEV